MRITFVLVAAAATLLVGGVACGGDGGSSLPTAVAPTPGVTAPSVPTSTRLDPTATFVVEGTREDGAIESPEAALRRQIVLLDAGDFAAAWTELHPAQQAIVPQQRFVECLAGTDYALALEIIDARDALIDVPELSRVPAKAIDTRLASGGTTLDRRFFEVLVEGRWRWVMEQPQIDAYRAGDCP